MLDKPGGLCYTAENTDKTLRAKENRMLSRLFANFIIGIRAFIIALIFDLRLANRELREA